MIGIWNLLSKKLCLLICLSCWVGSWTPSSAVATETTVFESVDQALAYSPQLQALIHNYRAVEHDLSQYRGRYLPSVDLMLGSGVEKHSDSGTRQPGN